MTPLTVRRSVALCSMALLLSVFATPVQAQSSDRWFLGAIGAYDIASATDMATTSFLIGQGSAREAGFAPFRQNLPAFSATKLALAATETYLLFRLHEHRPRLARWMAMSLAGAEVGLVLRNVRYAR